MQTSNPTNNDPTNISQFSEKELADKYRDPVNILDIIEELKKCPTLKEVRDIIVREKPDWIVDFIDSYSSDYAKYQLNWYRLCTSNKIKPMAIIRVRYLCNSPDFSLISTAAEIFTKSGFCVRDILDITPCKVCNRGLLSKNIYDAHTKKDITENKFPVVWQDKCSFC